MPCRNPRRLYIHLAFHLLRGSPKCNVKRTWNRLCLFYQWECLKCDGHGPSVSYVKRIKSSGAKIPTFQILWSSHCRPFSWRTRQPLQGSFPTYLVTCRPTWASSPPTSYLPAHDLPTDRPTYLPTSLLAKGPLARFLVGLANPRFSSASYSLLRFVVASSLVASIATLPRQRT